VEWEGERGEEEGEEEEDSLFLQGFVLNRRGVRKHGSSNTKQPKQSI